MAYCGADALIPARSSQDRWWARDRGASVGSVPCRAKYVRRLIAQGFTYKEIARELFISVKTVEGHVSSELRSTGSLPGTS